MKIGVLALQGAYEAHMRMLSSIGVIPSYVRHTSDLDSIDGLIIPGGESTTFLKLMEKTGISTALKQRIHLPIFGTCAGAILLSKYVTSPSQPSLGFVDVTIERNAYGRQLASRIVQGSCVLKNTPLEMVFIRAPRLCSILPNVKILAYYENEPVCVQQGHYLLATFHPELTNDKTLHQHFINMVKQTQQTC